jgi:hypothetical protein
MGVVDSDARGCLGCLGVVAVLVVAGVLGYAFLFDEASYPVEQEAPTVESARVLVTGADGGGYSIAQGESAGEQGDEEWVTGVIQPDPESYPVDIGMRDRDGGDYPEINVFAEKIGEWDGPLLIFLEVNGRIVDCGSSSRGPYVNFDVDDAESFDSNLYCRIDFWLS